MKVTIKKSKKASSFSVTVNYSVFLLCCLIDLQMTGDMEQQIPAISVPMPGKMTFMITIMSLFFLTKCCFHSGTCHHCFISIYDPFLPDIPSSATAQVVHSAGRKFIVSHVPESRLKEPMFPASPSIPAPPVETGKGCVYDLNHGKDVSLLI